MQEFIEYRNIEKSKKKQDYLFILEKSGIDQFIKVVKLTGITINPYNGEHKYLELITALNSELANRLSQEEYLK